MHLQVVGWCMTLQVTPTAAPPHVQDQNGPASHVQVATTHCRTLSQRIWDIDWSSVTPHVADEGFTIVMGSYESDAKPFIEAHFASIFGDHSDRFFVEPMTPAKQKFWDEMDIFVFKNASGETIGFAAGHPTDWSTYYVRTISLLPECRELGGAAHYARFINEHLARAGVHRRDAETSPANIPMNRFFFSEGAVVTSTSMSERWGVLLKYTKYLSADAEGVFRRQFINLPTHGRNPKPK
jgi:hypothetical protein